jgi:hypothetical protein
VPYDRTATLAPVTTEALDDLTQSVRDLRRGLRDPSAASKLLGSHQHSGSAIVLPPAATWLSPSQAKPTSELANCNLLISRFPP